MEKVKTSLWQLFVTFFKTGAFTFGGGMAMIALLEHEFVSKHAWLSSDEFLDVAAIAESTPGPIAVNAATFIGWRLLGFLGSLVATVGVCLPSFTIIYVISLVLEQFLGLTYVSYAFHGIQICVIYLIASAGIRMLKGQLKKAKGRKRTFQTAILCAVLLLDLGLTLFLGRFSSILCILCCGLAGFLFDRISHALGKEVKA